MSQQHKLLESLPLSDGRVRGEISVPDATVRGLLKICQDPAADVRDVGWRALTRLPLSRTQWLEVIPAVVRALEEVSQKKTPHESTDPESGLSWDSLSLITSAPYVPGTQARQALRTMLHRPGHSQLPAGRVLAAAGDLAGEEFLQARGEPLRPRPTVNNYSIDREPLPALDLRAPIAKLVEEFVLHARARHLRAALAWELSRRRVEEVLAAATPLLDDSDPETRFAAAALIGDVAILCVLQQKPAYGERGFPKVDLPIPSAPHTSSKAKPPHGGAGHLRPDRVEEVLPASAPSPAPTKSADAEDTALPASSAKPAREAVLLGANSPRSVRIGQRFTVNFIASIESRRAEVEKILQESSPQSHTVLGAQKCMWATGVTVEVRLRAEGIEVEEERQPFVWNGEQQILPFDCKVSPAAALGPVPLRLDAFIGGVRVAAVRLDIEITQSAASPAQVSATAAAYQSAFASYSSKDRQRVFDMVSALRNVAAIDVFLDVDTLRTGKKWKEQLEAEILAREAFILFWSKNAAGSHYVDWEWRTALARKPAEAFEVQPLEPPRDAPPPEELKDRHFGDALQSLRKLQELRDAAAGSAP
ncbi:MAG: TIR domain-containing protein [Planctomycetes bacterium]|nr:TIR domain-containing protein [Planctomycetota bacterium]